MGRVVLFILTMLCVGLASCSSVDTSWMVNKPSPLVYQGYYSPAGNSSPVVPAARARSAVTPSVRPYTGYYNPARNASPVVTAPQPRTVSTVSSPWASYASRDPYRRIARPASASFAPQEAGPVSATGKKPYE